MLLRSSLLGRGVDDDDDVPVESMPMICVSSHGKKGSSESCTVQSSRMNSDVLSVERCN